MHGEPSFHVFGVCDLAPAQSVCISEKLSVAIVSHICVQCYWHRNNIFWTLMLPGCVIVVGVSMSLFHAYCKLDKEDGGNLL
jgi:hypothetical protein